MRRPAWRASYWIYQLSNPDVISKCLLVLKRTTSSACELKEIKDVTDRRILGPPGPPCGGRLQSGLAASRSGPRTPGSPGSRPGMQSAWADCYTSSSPHHLYTALLKEEMERKGMIIDTVKWKEQTWTCINVQCRIVTRSSKLKVE